MAIDSKQRTKSLTQAPIIFFDGVCGLCNGFVDIVLARDKNHFFKFAPLQGSTFSSMQGIEDFALISKKHINPENGNTPYFGSVLYWDGSKLWAESDAALLILAKLGTVGKMMSWSRILPAAIRNFVYKIISKNRYKWFGKKESCRLPTPEERNYFLS